ncbi:ABC transporter substrate-binding protein [Streptomyces griseorubiginosus]|uniref:ABC transporter substrate-binding protein n=1 Tax=Streptomyces griseorubiginosus TaxID=67304 RepID=UPI00362E5FA8
MANTTVRMLCSDISHMAIGHVWRESGVTQKHGFDLVTHIANADVPGQPRVEMGERGPKVLSGEYDFMSGLHHETYAYRARGDKRFVYLAQAQNDWDDVLVASPAVDGLKGLEGKRVIVSTSAPCVYGNFRSALSHAGVDVDAVEFDVWKEQGTGVALRAVQAVLDGEADAADVDIPFDRYGTQRGLKVLGLPQMPVIHNTTICANREWVKQNEELTRSFLRSMIETIHFFKTRPKDVCDILQEHLAPQIGIEDPEDIAHLQRFWSQALSPKPYPHPLAIWNVYQLDTLKDERSNHIGPLEIWDTSYLRDIDDTDFVDSLYGGIKNTAAPAVNALI